MVACGSDRVPETLVLLKSALMFTKNDLNFFIFTEPHLKQEFIAQVNNKKFDRIYLKRILIINVSKKFKKWPDFIQNKFKYTIMETSFPESNKDEWRKLFKLCASQRLFLPVN